MILPALRPREFWARNIRTRAPTEHFRAYYANMFAKKRRSRWKMPFESSLRLPAQRMRLTDRGVLKAGMWADVVVFDPDTIRDLATFENPNQLSQGMEYVLVNGVAVIDQGKQTGALPGKVLRGAGYAQVTSLSGTKILRLRILCYSEAGFIGEESASCRQQNSRLLVRKCCASE